MPRQANPKQNDATGVEQSGSEGTIASTAKEQLQKMVDSRIGNGAQYLTTVATALRQTGDNLEAEAPSVAGVVKLASESIDQYANEMKNRSAKDLYQSSLDLTRRQPALVFGLAAFAGFLAFRSFKAAPSLIPEEDDV